MTDATPFLENVDSHWAAISGWTEDSGDLGDAEEFEDGDEPLSDDDDSDDDVCTLKSDSRNGFFLRLLFRVSLGGVAWRRVTSVQPASRQTTCCRLGNKTLGAVYTANHLALLLTKPGGSRKKIEVIFHHWRYDLD